MKRPAVCLELVRINRDRIQAVEPLAHAVHLTDTELDILRDKGPAVVHNPCSNARLGSGIARIREMLDHGITVAMGSDAGDTSDGYFIFDQMKMTAVMRRGAEPDFNIWISAPGSVPRKASPWPPPAAPKPSGSTRAGSLRANWPTSLY